mmetsp:Transcript_24186/g.37219  ORF Transcript_24186/g.37219 Transcript_24186/m.37219 type:complete len:153 (-) Transcript_24186:572-1030(-)|eukprot:CAMPEP_0170507356 /NCGR_PEP_ID=MMETSP0208-20121228/58573_1 /TAXON_ID=197538 /ORGANISM="Strombidium inclinatum, Strain S3" /LENGTH=152 /DNA_ID=CAMNT_0010789491 /DNA_START=2900 /DNA_END=3358 /DNA_ORIENTATION=-
MNIQQAFFETNLAVIKEGTDIKSDSMITSSKMGTPADSASGSSFPLLKKGTSFTNKRGRKMTLSKNFQMIMGQQKGPEKKRVASTSAATGGNVHLVTKKVEDEKFYDKLLISGLECIVSAGISNANLKGTVSCLMSTKNFKFDFIPILKQRY